MADLRKLATAVIAILDERDAARAAVVEAVEAYTRQSDEMQALKAEVAKLRTNQRASSVPPEPRQ